MEFINKIYSKFKSVFCRLLMLIKIIILSIFCRNKIYLFGTPVHGNLGDQAILLGEEKFLKDNFKNKKVIEVESIVVSKCYKLLKILAGKSTILIHGGGFLGSLWINEEEMFRKVLKTFTDNKIIVFPQTVYFSEDEEGRRIFEESKKIYKSHKDLYICCREKYSFDFMKKNMPDVNVLLIPDMVLYLDRLNDVFDRNNVLFCVRKDKEKVNYDFESLKDMLENKYNFNIDYTDTVIKNNIYTLKNRNNEVNKKINQFRKYKLVITDRLHGMVLAFLSNTPCLVFQNKSYKVKGVYEWINNANYIELSDTENMLKLAEKLLNNENKKVNDNNLIKNYNPLIHLINNSKENTSKEKETKNE